MQGRRRRPLPGGTARAVILLAASTSTQTSVCAAASGNPIVVSGKAGDASGVGRDGQGFLRTQPGVSVAHALRFRPPLPLPRPPPPFSQPPCGISCSSRLTFAVGVKGDVCNAGVSSRGYPRKDKTLAPPCRASVLSVDEAGCDDEFDAKPESKDDGVGNFGSIDVGTAARKLEGGRIAGRIADGRGLRVMDGKSAASMVDVGNRNRGAVSPRGGRNFERVDIGVEVTEWLGDHAADSAAREGRSRAIFLGGNDDIDGELSPAGGVVRDRIVPQRRAGFSPLRPRPTESSPSGMRVIGRVEEGEGEIGSATAIGSVGGIAERLGSSKHFVLCPALGDDSWPASRFPVIGISGGSSRDDNTKAVSGGSLETSRAGSTSNNSNIANKEGLGHGTSSSSSGEVRVGSDIRAAAVGSTRSVPYAGDNGEGGWRRGGVKKTQQRRAPATRERAASSPDLAVEDDTPRGGGRTTIAGEDNTMTTVEGLDNGSGATGRELDGKDRVRNGEGEQSTLRGLLREAVRKGHGGAALRSLRLMVKAGDTVTEKEYVGAMKACMRQGSWTSGLEAFRLLLEYLRPRGLSPGQATWRALARGLRSVGQADQGVAVLRQALEGGVEGIDEQVCSILLDLCAVKGRMGLAEEISSLMEAHGIRKGPVTFCVLLKGYGRQRRLGRVVDVMDEMKARGVVPDVVALNAAVDAFVRCGELTKAKKVLAAMEDAPEGSQAQTLTYNTIIKGLGRELLIEEAFDVARGMINRGCFPDEVTTNSLVDICVRCGDLDRAYSLLKNPTLIPPPQTESSGTKKVYNQPRGSTMGKGAKMGTFRGPVAGTVPRSKLRGRIPGLGAAEVPDWPGPAWRAPSSPEQEVVSESFQGPVLRSEIDSSGVSDQAVDMDGESWAESADRAGTDGSDGDRGQVATTEAAGVLHGDAEKALSEGGTGSPGRVRSSGEEQVNGDGDEDQARRRAGEQGRMARPSVEAFTSVLTGFAGVGDKDRALAVFQQMVNAGVEPNLITYTALISACVNAGDINGAKRLFGALEARGATTPSMQPSVVTYNTLIRGLCRQSTTPAADGGTEYPTVDTTTRDPTVNTLRDPTVGTMQDSTQDPTVGGMSNDPSGFGETTIQSDGKGFTPEYAGAQGIKADRVQRRTRSVQIDPVEELPGSLTVRDLGEGAGNGAPDYASSPASLLDGPGLLSPVGSPEANSRLPQGIQEALRLLLSMRRRGAAADEITMNSILNGLVSCAPPRVHEAEAILKLMTGWGLKPNQVSYTVMLKGYGRKGDLGGSEVMFELMCNDKDQKPDVVALNSLLDACVRNGDFRRAVEILEQSMNTALMGRAITVPHKDWVSSTRRAWGEKASVGALELGAAGGVGELARGRDVAREPGGSSGRRRGKNSDRDSSPRGSVSGGVAIDVRPNQVSFATVVMALARRGDPPAGRKAIALYECMRRSFGFMPDEGMIDGLMASCCNAQAAEAGTDDGAEMALARGEEALRELLDLGWDEELIRQKQQILRRVVPTVSEVWKRADGLEDGGSSVPRKTKRAPRNDTDKPGGRKKKVSAEIFEKYGWNSMDSHFPIL